MKKTNLLNKTTLLNKITFFIIIYTIYVYIFRGYISYLPTIPIYPNNNKDLKLLKQQMNQRTNNDIELFFKTNDSVVHAFLPYVNETEENLNKIATSQNHIILFFKYLINRRRPYQIDINLKPLSTLTSQTPAYPAGHAYQALLVASYLSTKYPDKKKIFDNIAYECDKCRVKAGIHYISDGKFSKTLFHLFN